MHDHSAKLKDRSVGSCLLSMASIELFGSLGKFRGDKKQKADASRGPGSAPKDVKHCSGTLLCICTDVRYYINMGTSLAHKDEATTNGEQTTVTTTQRRPTVHKAVQTEVVSCLEAKMSLPAISERTAKTLYALSPSSSSSKRITHIRTPTTS